MSTHSSTLAEALTILLAYSDDYGSDLAAVLSDQAEIDADNTAADGGPTPAETPAVESADLFTRESDVDEHGFTLTLTDGSVFRVTVAKVR